MIWISPYIALHRNFLGTRENTLALFGHKFKLIPPGNSFRINVVFVWDGGCCTQGRQKSVPYSNIQQRFP